MSHILIYANKSRFSCVIAENTDATLELLSPKMEAQINDLLCFCFKFTPLVNSKLATVEVKQEAVIKLK